MGVSLLLRGCALMVHSLLQSLRSEWRLFYGLCCAILFFVIEIKGIQLLSRPFLHRQAPLEGLYTGINSFNTGIFDGSDGQYGKFRLGLMDMSLYFLVFAVGGYLWKRIFRLNENEPKTSEYSPELIPESPTKDYTTLCVYYLLHAVGFLYIGHANSLVIFVSIVMIFYWISKLNGSPLNPILTWGFGLIVLTTCDAFSGYSLSPWLLDESHWFAQWLDNYRGELRWHVYYRLTFLKLVSFNMDKYWAYQRNPAPHRVVGEFGLRTVSPLPKGYYNLISFWTYIGYSPLYVAGPIISFNNFVSQLLSPIQQSWSEFLKQVLWTTVIILLLDVLVHYSCLYAISVSNIWENWHEAWHVGLVGFWSMQFMYLKYLCFWRYFRVAAMADGIMTIDNMPRCMHNNCTFTDFWRSWHASFNQWTIRYLYVPLGGRKYQQYSIWLIFFFIGIWHDLWWSWISWALLNCLCFSLEIALMKFWASSRWDPIRDTWWAEAGVRLLQAWNIVLLLCCNLAIIYGFDHIGRFMYLTLFGHGAWKVYLFVCVILTGGCYLQYEVKSRETKRAIKEA